MQMFSIVLQIHLKQLRLFFVLIRVKTIYMYSKTTETF